MTDKIYVDTNLVSRLSDELYGNPPHISEIEANAILKICSADIELVTSTKMLDEVLETTALRPRALLTLMATLAGKVPFQNITFFVPATLGGSYLGSSYLGGGYSARDPLLTQLLSIFDQNDAEHVFQAIKNNCAFFLTLDNSSIVQRAKNNRQTLNEICPGLKFVLPKELADQLTPKA